MGKYMRNHIGEEIITNQGYLCEVIDGGTKYGNVIATVYSDNGDYTTEISHKSITAKTIKTPYHRSFLDVGYMGEGKYYAKKDKVMSIYYHRWSEMMIRCYDPYYLNEKKNKKYINAFVCDEWHNYQNFAEWMSKNYYISDNCRWMDLDKDLIGDGKLYSPENCCFIPHKLNVFISNKSNHGKVNYRGISKRNSYYTVRIVDVVTGDRLNLGRYKSLEESVNVYKNERKKQSDKIRSICINQWNITNKTILKNIK